MTQSLFDKYGGISGVQAIIHKFYETINQEPKLARFFGGVDMERLMEHQVALFCKILGGPDNYNGSDLKTAHAKLRIDTKAFDLVSHILRKTLLEFRIDDTDIVVIMAAVEQTRPQIVTHIRPSYLRDAMDSLASGFAVVDIANNEILECNSTFMEWAPAALKSNDFSPLRAMLLPEHSIQQLDAAGSHQFDVSVTPKAGRAILVEVSITRMPQSESLQQLVLIQMHNVSKIQEKEFLLRAATKQLEKNNLKLADQRDELKQLIRTMSHDLMNPLSVIMGYASLGADNISQGDYSNIKLCFEKVLRAVQSQRDIIEHVKFMRALEDGKFNLQLSSVNLHDIIQDAKDTFEKILEEKKVTLNVDSEALKNLKILAEPTSVKHHVVNNIISNAIKFSHPGQEIDITASGSNDSVNLIIQDHGIGIPEKMIEHLFKTDQPTSRTGTNGEKGTGYGMPVVKAYMKRYGGDIEVESCTADANCKDPGTKITLKFAPKS